MALKLWSELASNECVAHAEVRDGVATGELAWRTSEPSLVSGYCYTRADFEAYIRHVSMAPSGIATNELMSKAEMLTYREVPAITPENVQAVQDYSACPIRRVVLTWTARTAEGPMELQHQPDGSGSWATLATIAAGVQIYVHGSNGPTAGINRYRIRYTARSEWATATVAVACID